MVMALTTSELDFANNPYSPADVNKTSELLDLLEKSVADAKSHLEKAKDDDLIPNWTLRTGDNIHVVNSKDEVIRMTYNQITHHRAQLGVYLRLLNIPIPGSYGPSADEMDF